MKLKERQEYEVQIAKTTLPKDYTFLGLFEIDKWYPARKHRVLSGVEILCDGCWYYSMLRGTSHLGGGNWKVRKVKEGKRV